MSSLATRYSSNEDEARQGLNFAFLKVLQNLKKYDSNFAFATFLRTIFVRHFIDEYRKNKQLQDLASIDAVAELEMPVTQNEVHAVFESEYLDHLMNLLPLATRTVFVMHVVDGYNYQEIAELLEVSESTCRWHVNAARKTLQKHWEAHKKIVQSQAI